MPDIDALTAGFQAALQPLNQIVGDTTDEDREWNKCRDDVVYFITNYVHIFWKDRGTFDLFDLWPFQLDMLKHMRAIKHIITLKSRQQGATWLCLADLLHRCIFAPQQQSYLFSIGDREAKDLTGFRLTNMVNLLPDWMRQRCGGITTGVHSMLTGHGSRVTSLPSTAGRSYTATYVLVDEGDFNPDLNALLAACKPAVEGGGQIVLLSTSDKSKPMSRFKSEYRLAKEKKNNFTALFYGWKSHPGRTQEWYDNERRSVMASTGALDLIFQEYPNTDAEALAPRSLDKRIAATWLQQCMAERQPIPVQTAMRTY